MISRCDRQDRSAVFVEASGDDLEEEEKEEVGEVEEEEEEEMTRRGNIDK